ncbi:MAG: hypothetical protein ABIG44_13445 [Planctomycetota bacterium]
MSFASGLISYQRFFVDGHMPADVNKKFMSSVESRSFGRASPRPDDTQMGWIGPGHLLETDIVAERVAFGRFAHLAVRIDRLRPPANVLKAYARIEEEAALTASGREYLSRGERQTAREAAKLRAEQETRAGGFRRMNSYPVLIDLEGKYVYLGNQGLGLAEKFGQLFSETFGSTLEPAGPEQVAARQMARAERLRALESLTPNHLVDPPRGFMDEPADLATGDLEFLGHEFLTWLWYQTDQDEGPLRIHSGDDVTTMIERTVRLKCDYNLTGTNVITADSPTTLPEAKSALAIGKQPTRAGLILGCPLGEFRLTLDGPRLAVSSLVLPESDAAQDARARLEQRFELVTDVAGLLDALFEVYMLERTGRKWSGLARAMSKWVCGNGAQKTRRGRSA